MIWSKKQPEPYTHIGTGIHLDHPDKILNLGFPDSYRKGHFWCFGTTRVGKTRTMEGIIEQDIRKGYSVVAIDPKGDIDLLSKIIQIALETGRKNDLMLVTPVFPQYSAILNPLSHYYMIEELVGHITAGVAVGREPYFFSVAYETSLVVVQALLLLAEANKQSSPLNLAEIKKHISHDCLKKLKEKIDHIKTPQAQQLSLDLEKIVATPADFYSKTTSSLRVALTELTAGNVGRIIGQADENRFIDRLEKNKGIILIMQLGSLLTKRAAYTAGKVIISTIQAFVGRRYSSDQQIYPPMTLHIDEAQSVLYQGIEELFAKAGGAGLYINGYCQSVNQLYAEITIDRANTILDNCNTKLFMRVPDANTANYVSEHLGEKRVFSPVISLGGGLAIRETEDVRVKHTEVLNMAARQFFMTTYNGIFRGITADVSGANLRIIFPEIQTQGFEDNH
jgi:conjugal transfer pilus assembly protein TraD